MENQPIVNCSETTPINSASISQSPVFTQAKTNLLIPILSTVLVSAIVFGFGGYYLGKQSYQLQQYPNQSQLTPTNLPESSPTISPVTKTGLTTYTSSFEKLSLQYPSNWRVIQPRMESNFPEGDELSIESPSGKLIILWVSGIDGLGGSCDPNAAYGTEGDMGRACSLYEVVDKQKLPNADLYFVAYITTNDGINYQPIFALQDTDGILTSKRTMGYLIFTGKNNGGASVELSGEPSKSGLVYGTKDDAKKFFTNPEAIQAKDILLSVSY